MNYIAFDIETAEMPQKEDGTFDYENAGIACAAAEDGDGTVLWRSPDYDPGEMFDPRITPQGCQMIVDYLADTVEAGYTLCAWNGNFDLRILAHESGELDRCRDLALNMIDPMFQFLTFEGYCVGLEKVAQAFGLGSKVGMHGDQAPVLWKESREAQEKVLEYVAGDVKLTRSIVQKIEEHKAIFRYTRAGNFRSTEVKELLTVRQCLEHEQADTPWWADNPWKVGTPGDRRSFVEWMQV